MTSTRAEQTTVASLAVLGAFQLALAAGAPWGRAAYGGARAGILPTRLRVVSGAAGVAYVSGSVLVARGVGSSRARQRAFTALSVFMGVGTLANAASRSSVERALWTPVTALAAASTWWSRAAPG